MLDIIIKNGQVVNGSGKEAFIADISIKDDLIVKVGHLDENAETVINAAGLCVCPGFIDMHSHSDFSLLANPNVESKVRQGITTEVIGNCGASAAPVLTENLGLIKEKSNIEELGLDWDWLSMDDYLNLVRKKGISLNIVPLIGHNTVRAAVMRYEQRPPTADELSMMKTLISRAMDQGARGLSTGLIYAPGCYADTSELVALAEAVSEKNGIYTSHLRSESNQFIEAVQEAVSIGEKAGLPVHLSHHKAIGEDNWGKVDTSLALIDEANRKGVEVTADQYPYTASSTGLTSILPYWVLEGSLDDLKKRLGTKEDRGRIKEEMVVRQGYYENTFVSYCPNHPELEGKTLQAFADSENCNPVDAVLNLLFEADANVDIVSFGISKEDVNTVIAHPRVMFGSDGRALADYGILHRGKPHPRSYGTFPRILGKYVREERVLTIEEAIRKMTSFPARTLGLSDRGLLEQGLRADITIFNPHTVRDRATFEDPHQYPEGIDYVLVNGRLVIDKGDHTEAKSGDIL